MGMIKATQINVETIRAIFKSRDARKGEKLLLALLDREQNLQAEYLLRHHSILSIIAYETYPRDQIDQLLSYYSILFIALASGAIHLEDIGFEIEKIHIILNYAPLVKYYSENYRIRIPILFCNYL